MDDFELALPIFYTKPQNDSISGAKIITRNEHNVSRSLISEAALRVLYHLLKAGYDAYLVGGGVRDLLLGRAPKDFDITTNARPEQVRQLFRNCRLVGRRFLLAHVHFGQEIIEVATFRASYNREENNKVIMEGGRIVRDNVYGTLEQDAWRRDFTVNALYYNIRDFSVLDFCNGIADLKNQNLRIIGEPHSRYHEDPVRMLRAVRFAAKLDFNIDPDTELPINKLAFLLREIPPARLFDEVLKIFLNGKGLKTFELLRRYRLFIELFPRTEKLLNPEKNPLSLKLLQHALHVIDNRIINEQSVDPALLFAILLWEPVRWEMQRQINAPLLELIQFASDRVIQEQIRRVAIPRRYTLQIRDIWLLQGRFLNMKGKKHLSLLAHANFRNAYDLLLMRFNSGEDVHDIAIHWTKLQLDRGMLLDNPLQSITV